MLFSRENRHLYTLSEFGHTNPDLLIIVCDPATDRMYAMYKNRFVNTKIKSNTGKSTHVVRDVLRYSLFEKNVDSFLGTIVEFLHLPIMKGNQFYKVIDGFLYNIAKSLLKAKKPVPGAVKSPFVEKSINNKQ